jgi:hypothetical protein
MFISFLFIALINFTISKYQSRIYLHISCSHTPQVTNWDDHLVQHCHHSINLIHHPSEFPRRLNPCPHSFQSSGCFSPEFANLARIQRPAQPTKVSSRHHLIYMSRPTTVYRYCGVKLWGNIPGTTYRVEILDTCGIEIYPSSGLLLINTAVIDDRNTTIKTDRHG